MRCIIFANGEYGNDLEIYRKTIQDEDIVICADGGANYAHAIDVIPSVIIGDMDSILPGVRQEYLDKHVPIRKFPLRKDFTDTQLAVSTAQEMGADEILLLGTLGKRLDHTLSNLYCSMDLVEHGVRVTHAAPDCFVYVINDYIEITGQKGDLVSILPLTEEAANVHTEGFEYALPMVTLEQKNPYAVSNVLQGQKGKISLSEGILAVFQYIDSTNL
ncbi:MAG: thiamine diphosphokinase [Bacillota bacterium]|nr:thiamine diphosphokinase [Bacillota bacterium]